MKWDVHIRRVSTQNVVFDDGGPELVLLLQGPVRDCAPSQSRLIQVFGLTPAEAKLTAHLIDGLTLTAAAEALGISRNTARAQLSSIFAKTGVNRVELRGVDGVLTRLAKCCNPVVGEPILGFVTRGKGASFGNIQFVWFI